MPKSMYSSVPDINSDLMESQKKVEPLTKGGRMLQALRDQVTSMKMTYHKMPAKKNKAKTKRRNTRRKYTRRH
jgi:hypothetical protein